MMYAGQQSVSSDSYSKLTDPCVPDTKIEMTNFSLSPPPPPSFQLLSFLDGLSCLVLYVYSALQTAAVDSG